MSERRRARPAEEYGTVTDEQANGPRKYYVDGRARDRDRAGIRPGPRRQQTPRRPDHAVRRRHGADAVYTDPRDSARSGPTSSSGPRSSSHARGRGIDFDELAAVAQPARRRPVRPPLPPGLQCPTARTRESGPNRLRKEKKDFFDQYGPEARTILNELLDKYAEHGTAQFALPETCSRCRRSPSTAT